jgi:hypothetical protein
VDDRASILGLAADGGTASSCRVGGLRLRQQIFQRPPDGFDGSALGVRGARQMCQPFGSSGMTRRGSVRQRAGITPEEAPSARESLTEFQAPSDDSPDQPLAKVSDGPSASYSPCRGEGPYIARPFRIVGPNQSLRPPKDPTMSVQGRGTRWLSSQLHSDVAGTKAGAPGRSGTAILGFLGRRSRRLSTPMAEGRPAIRAVSGRGSASLGEAPDDWEDDIRPKNNWLECGANSPD